MNFTLIFTVGGPVEIQENQDESENCHKTGRKPFLKKQTKSNPPEGTLQGWFSHL